MKSYYKWPLAIGVISIVVFYAVQLGFVTHLEGVNKDRCVYLDENAAVDGLLSCVEDATLFEGYVFASADPQRMHMMDAGVAKKRRGKDYPHYDKLKDWVFRLSDMSPDEQGAILVASVRDVLNAYDDKASIRGPIFHRVPVTGWNWKENPDFHPHGINVYRSPSAKKDYIAVVMHGRRGDSVDLFELQRKADPENPQKLAWEMQFVHSFVNKNVILNANDVALVDSLENPGEVEVYGTNYFASSNDNPMGITVEQFTLRPWGSVFRCSISRGCDFLIKGLIQPNGIQAHIVLDESYSPKPFIQLFVAGFLENRVLVYHLSPQAEPDPRPGIYVDRGLDNIEFVRDSAGTLKSLLLGAHRKLYRTLMMLSNLENRAPNAVFELRYNNERKELEERVSVVYQDPDPEHVGAVSVALELEPASNSRSRKLLMGSPFDTGMLLCSLN